MRKALVIIAAVVPLAAACGGGGGGTTDPPMNGSVTGTVSGRGGGIPNATISLAGGGTQTTNGEGQFSFSNVSAGAKTLSLAPPTGFTLATGETAEKSASVAAGGTATVNWSLQLANTNPRTVDVEMGAVTFAPSDVVVPVGSTVRWVNGTATTHTVTPNNASQPGAWQDVTVSGSGTVFSHQFNTAGTYPYNCRLHGGMTGTVRVH